MVTTVKIMMRNLSSEIKKTNESLEKITQGHEKSIEHHSEVLSDHNARLAVVESKLDQTIRHIGTQLDRIYKKLFGD